MENGAYISPLAMLLGRLARPLLVTALLTHGGAAIAAVVAEITITEVARYQVITVVAFMTQVAVRMVAHPGLPPPNGALA